MSYKVHKYVQCHSNLRCMSDISSPKVNNEMPSVAFEMYSIKTFLVLLHSTKNLMELKLTHNDIFISTHSFD